MKKRTAMKKLLSLLSTLLIVLQPICAHAQSINGGINNPPVFPSSGKVVLSNGSNAPGGIAPVNGQCLIGSAGAWVSGACSAGGGVTTTGSPLSGQFAVFSGASTITGDTAGAALDALTGATTTGGQYLNRTGTGAWTAQSVPTVMGKCFLQDFSPTFGTLGETSQGTTLENFLLDCQRKAIAAGAAHFANLERVGCYEAIINGNELFGIKLNTSIVVPRYVCLSAFGTNFVRDGTSGTITSNWTGDTTVKDLANLEQPFFIFPYGGQLTGSLKMNLNSVGASTDGGSGVFYGRSWRVKTLAISAGGSGFVGGETCTMANGDTLSPNAGTPFTCAAASGGACTSLTFAPTRWGTTGGYYALPPVLQALQWTSANGWNGGDTYHPTVFSSTHYVTTCSGAGTGLTVDPTWWADWESGDTTYDGDFGNPGANTGYIHDLIAAQSRDRNDVTFGPTRGFVASGADLEIDRVQTSFARIGQEYFGSDIRTDIINDVSSHTQLKLHGGGAFHFNTAVLDTPFGVADNDAHALEVDNCQDCSINFATIFHNSSSATTLGTNQIRFGSDTSISDATHQNSYVVINAGMYSSAASGSNLTAFGCAFTLGSTIDINISNLTRAGAPNPQQFTQFASFGTGCAVGNRITGSINNVSGSLFTGTVPTAGINIWSGQDQAWRGITPLMRTFQLSGNLAVANDQTNWIIMPSAGVLTKVWAVAKTGPVGAAAIFDIQKSTNNGASFTSIWNSTPANKITIADGQVAGTTTAFDTSTYNAGDIYRIDVDQIGSTTAGANVTIVLDGSF